MTYNVFGGTLSPYSINAADKFDRVNYMNWPDDVIGWLMTLHLSVWYLFCCRDGHGRSQGVY